MSKDSRSRLVLDVDESIMEKNLFVMPEEKRDPMENLFQPSTTMPSKIVKPAPGLCVKTHTVPENIKVFINICQTDAVPPPKEINATELMEILSSMDPDSYKVPMSIGDPRDDLNAKKQHVKVIDIAIHSTYFKKISKDDLFKSFLFKVVFEALEFKHNITVNGEECVVLKNKKAFGELQTHRIQDRDLARIKGIQHPDLDRLEQKRIKRKPNIEVMDVIPKLKTPIYRILQEPAVGAVQNLIGEFLLNGVISIKEFNLDIGEDRIVLEAPAPGLFLDIFVPHNIIQEKVAAQFNTQTSILTVTMPVAELA